MNNIVLNKIMIFAIIIASVVLFYMGVIKFFVLFFPFILGYVISKMVGPIVNFLHKYIKLPNNLSTVIVIMTLVGLVSYVVYLAGTGIVSALGDLAVVLPSWGSAIIQFGTELSERVSDLTLRLPFNPAELISKGIAAAIDMLSKYAGKFATTGFTIATSVPSILIGLIIIILSAFFFTKDRNLIKETIGPSYERYIGSNTYINDFKRDILSVIVGYLKAQLTLMTVTFTISSIGLTLIGVPKALLIGLGVGIVDALPLFGPSAVYWPWIGILLITGQSSLALKIFFLYLTTTITRQLLEPKVLGSHIGVHPLLTLTALYLGVKLLGVPGLILGPFTMVTLVASYKRYVKKTAVAEPIKHKKVGLKH